MPATISGRLTRPGPRAAKREPTLVRRRGSTPLEACGHYGMGKPVADPCAKPPTGGSQAEEKLVRSFILSAKLTLSSPFIRPANKPNCPLSQAFPPITHSAREIAYELVAAAGGPKPPASRGRSGYTPWNNHESNKAIYVTPERV
jgi:hypothetical protein